jgi:hypothetical protein
MQRNITRTSTSLVYMLNTGRTEARKFLTLVSGSGMTLAGCLAARRLDAADVGDVLASYRRGAGDGTTPRGWICGRPGEGHRGGLTARRCGGRWRRWAAGGRRRGVGLLSVGGGARGRLLWVLLSARSRRVRDEEEARRGNSGLDGLRLHWADIFDALVK